jgi:hypothetical protein
MTKLEAMRAAFAELEKQFHTLDIGLSDVALGVLIERYEAALAAKVLPDACGGVRVSEVELTEEDADDIKHSLMGGQRKHVYRNHYAACFVDFPRFDALVERGLMRKGVSLTYGRVYHVTEAGAAAVGLHLPRDE